MSSLQEALAEIPTRRDELSGMDHYLSKVIRHVEHVLHDGLRVSMPCQVTYDTEGGRFVLRYGKWNNKWQIVWGTEADDETKDTALVSTSRAVRAEVFTREATGQSPIERLLIAAAESLTYFIDERQPQIEVARQLLKTLETAGFPLLP